MPFEPSQDQRDAHDAVLEWWRGGRQEFYLAGWAGTGKSTLAAIVINALGLRHVMTGAYTGKAAHVMRRKGAPNAATIHSMAYCPVPDSDPVEFTLDLDSDLTRCDLLVLDEVSMVSEEMADDLRRLARRILVLGDPGQLPPVRGAGAFTERQPDALLTEIHRQAAESPILRLATRAREGRGVPCGVVDDVEVRRAGADPVKFIEDGYQIICGVHRKRWQVTESVRSAFGHDGALPRKGERLICRRNDKDHGLFNGMLAEAIADAKSLGTWQCELTVRLEDGHEDEFLCTTKPFRELMVREQLPVERYQKGIQTFDFSYALTCHSAQGSEFPAVLLYDDSRYFREDASKWLYTGITRAQEKLTVVVK